MKSVQIRIFFWSRKNSVFGHFSRNGCLIHTNIILTYLPTFFILFQYHPRSFIASRHHFWGCSRNPATRSFGGMISRQSSELVSETDGTPLPEQRDAAANVTGGGIFGCVWDLSQRSKGCRHVQEKGTPAVQGLLLNSRPAKQRVSVSFLQKWAQHPAY